MKKTILSLLPLLLAATVSCQERNPFRFGVEINPKITHQIFNEPDLAKASDFLGLGVGGSFSLNTGTGYVFKTGLFLHKIEIDQKDSSFRFGCQNNGQGGFDEDAYISSTYSIYYVGIPITHRFVFSEKPNHLYGELGTDIWFKIKQSGMEFLKECGTNSTSVFSLYQPAPYLINLNLAVGYGVVTKTRQTIYIGPVLEGSLTKIFKKIGGSGRDILNNSVLASAGLKAGIQF